MHRNLIASGVAQPVITRTPVRTQTSPAPKPFPWTGLSDMLLRRNTNPDYPGVLSPEQAITLEQALPIFTTNGARSLGMGDSAGCLKAGYWSDFIVLKKSLHKLSADEIAQIEVQQTVWKGHTVHQV
jgi:predicted amidohydrolase YtcJ